MVDHDPFSWVTHACKRSPNCTHTKKKSYNKKNWAVFFIFFFFVYQITFLYPFVNGSGWTWAVIKYLLISLLGVQGNICLWMLWNPKGEIRKKRNIFSETGLLMTSSFESSLQRKPMNHSPFKLGRYKFSCCSHSSIHWQVATLNWLVSSIFLIIVFHFFNHRTPFTCRWV